MRQTIIHTAACVALLLLSLVVWTGLDNWPAALLLLFCAIYFVIRPAKRFLCLVRTTCETCPDEDREEAERECREPLVGWVPQKRKPKKQPGEGFKSFGEGLLSFVEGVAGVFGMIFSVFGFILEFAGFIIPVAIVIVLLMLGIPWLQENGPKLMEKLEEGITKIEQEIDKIDVQVTYDEEKTNEGSKEDTGDPEPAEGSVDDNARPEAGTDSK